MAQLLSVPLAEATLAGDEVIALGTAAGLSISASMRRWRRSSPRALLLLDFERID